MTQAGDDTRTAEGTILLPDQLTIAQSAEYYGMLMSRIEEGGLLELDAGSVERIDAAGVQMLFAIQGALARAGCTLHWVGVSQALRESVELLGMTGSLAVPAES